MERFPSLTLSPSMRAAFFAAFSASCIYFDLFPLRTQEIKRLLSLIFTVIMNQGQSLTWSLLHVSLSYGIWGEFFF